MRIIQWRFAKKDHLGHKNSIKLQRMFEIHPDAESSRMDKGKFWGFDNWNRKECYEKVIESTIFWFPE